MATPAASFSVIVTVTLSAVTEAYSPVPLTVWLRVTAWSVTASSSWAALTVTVWGVSQFSDVKVRVDGVTDTSVPSWPLIGDGHVGAGLAVQHHRVAGAGGVALGHGQGQWGRCSPRRVVVGDRYLHVVNSRADVLGSAAVGHSVADGLGVVCRVVVLGRADRPGRLPVLGPSGSVGVSADVQFLRVEDVKVRSVDGVTNTSVPAWPLMVRRSRRRWAGRCPAPHVSSWRRWVTSPSGHTTVSSRSGVDAHRSPRRRR